MKLGDKPRRSPENAVREIDGDVFIMNPDTSELHGLSEVGALIWGRIDGDYTVSDIVDLVVAEYEVERDVAEADAIEFLDELVAKGLVTVA